MENRLRTDILVPLKKIYVTLVQVCTAKKANKMYNKEGECLQEAEGLGNLLMS